MAGYFFFETVNAPDVANSAFEKINVLEEPIVQPGNWNDIVKTVGGINFKLIPKAKIKIACVVVSINSTNYDEAKELSPVDLGVAWGKLADKDMYKYIKYASHFNREWLIADKFDCPLGDAYSHSHISNNHIIPADENILKVIKKSKKKCLLIEGYLTDIRAQIPSGTFCMDTDLVPGNRMCEIIYVTRITMDDKVYE